MNTMNEMDDDTRHSYDQYANEVLQLEWEQHEQARQLMQGDQPQVQHDSAEHTGANAPVTVADDGLHDDHDGVKWCYGHNSAEPCQNCQEWDEWLDDVYSAEELERAQREEEEERNDH